MFERARFVHNGMRALLVELGMPLRRTERFDELTPIDQEQLARAVAREIAEPAVSDRDAHQRWRLDMELRGWRYGERYDPDARTHPCLVPFERLGVEDRLRDALFRALCWAASRIPEAPR